MANPVSSGGFEAPETITKCNCCGFRLAMHACDYCAVCASTQALTEAPELQPEEELDF